MPKILLVEDDQNLREIFEMRLQAEGYETLSAGDGEEALVKAMKEKPDLIIADVMMPKLSGFEMLETLRAAPEMSEVKVVMMTALGQAEDRARGEKLGVVKYLVKSQVTLEDFVRVVHEVLQPDQADAAKSAAPATNSAEAESLATNNQESEKPMPEDTTTPPTNDPSMPSPGSDMPSDKPMDVTPPASDAGGSDQMSSAQEQSNVQGQIDDFVSSSPATPPSDTPADGGTAPAGGDMGGGASTTPPTEPPQTPPAGGMPGDTPSTP